MLKSKVDTLVGLPLLRRRIGPPGVSLAEQADLGPNPFGPQTSDFDLSPYLRRSPVEISRLHAITGLVALFLLGSAAAVAASGDDASIDISKRDAKSAYSVEAVEPSPDPEPIPQPRLVAPEREVAQVFPAPFIAPEPAAEETEAPAEPGASAPEPAPLAEAPRSQRQIRAARQARRRVRARRRTRAERRRARRRARSSRR